MPFCRNGVVVNTCYTRFHLACCSSVVFPVGAHPQNYHQFMAVLCSYIVQKQREFQGEELPKALVYVSWEGRGVCRIAVVKPLNFNDLL